MVMTQYEAYPQRFIEENLTMKVGIPKFCSLWPKWIKTTTLHGVCNLSVLLHTNIFDFLFHNLDLCTCTHVNQYRSAPTGKYQKMEVVFLTGNFPMISGRFLTERTGSSPKSTKKKSENFPTGILLLPSGVFRCSPAENDASSCGKFADPDIGNFILGLSSKSWFIFQCLKENY